jgi:hypothetical protein
VELREYYAIFPQMVVAVGAVRRCWGRRGLCGQRADDAYYEASTLLMIGDTIDK